MNHNSLNQACFVVGILIIIVCLVFDIPAPYRKSTLIMIPILLLINYFCTNEISAKMAEKNIEKTKYLVT